MNLKEELLLRHLNIPYYWGGDNPLKGMDCCLAKDTLVQTSNGFEKIQNIKIGTMVPTIENGKIKYKEVINIHKNGIKKVYRVTSAGGEIFATDNHRFLAVKHDPVVHSYKIRNSRRLEWIELKDLKKEDYILLSTKQSPPEEKMYSDEAIQFYGAMLGDGYIHSDNNAFSLCFVSEKKQKLLSKYIEFAKIGLGFKNNESFSMIQGLTFSDVNSTNKLIEMGFGGKSKERTLPSWVFKLSNSQLKKFLQGYLDADGYRFEREIKNHYGYSIGSASEDLIRQLNVLLLSRGYRLGPVKIRKRDKSIIIKGKLVKNPLPFFHFDITDGEFNGPERLGPDPYGDMKIEKDFHFARIRNIEENKEIETYDLTIEGSHNYFAQGFVVHNSGWTQWYLAQFGLDPQGDQTAQGLYDYFLINCKDKTQDLGALSFYGKSNSQITHVAIHLSPMLIVEAGSGNATTTTYQMAMEQGACVRVRPVNRRKDYIGTLMPNYPAGLD